MKGRTASWTEDFYCSVISHCLIIAGGTKMKILYKTGNKAHVLQIDQETERFTKL